MEKVSHIQNHYNQQSVSSIDILPTIVEAVGGKLPDGLDGKSLMNFITGKSDLPVHEHLVWAGLQSRAWGFLLHTSFKSHGSERNFAPAAWVVIKDDHMLRFIGSIEPNLNIETPKGAPAKMELFNIANDVAEQADVSSEFPEKVDELMNIFRKESVGFKPPVSWKMEKWEELEINTIR